MDQITWLQPKGLVVESFIKNICAFSLDSIISQRFVLDSLKKMSGFYLCQEASQARAFEKINFHVSYQEQL